MAAVVVGGYPRGVVLAAILAVDAVHSDIFGDLCCALSAIGFVQDAKMDDTQEKEAALTGCD